MSTVVAPPCFFLRRMHHVFNATPTVARSLPCGHTLDRASVDQILRSQGAPKCPFPGCKQRLDRDQFVADEEMLALMRRRATKENCKRAGGM